MVTQFRIKCFHATLLIAPTQPTGHKLIQIQNTNLNKVNQPSRHESLTETDIFMINREQILKGGEARLTNRPSRENDKWLNGNLSYSSL